MPSSCVKDCINRQVKLSLIKFHRFPFGATGVEKLQKWLSAIRRKDWEPNHGTRICSDHFISGKNMVLLVVVWWMFIDNAAFTTKFSLNGFLERWPVKFAAVCNLFKNLPSLHTRPRLNVILTTVKHTNTFDQRTNSTDRAVVCI